MLVQVVQVTICRASTRALMVVSRILVGTNLLACRLILTPLTRIYGYVFVVVIVIIVYIIFILIILIVVVFFILAAFIVVFVVGYHIHRRHLVHLEPRCGRGGAVLAGAVCVCVIGEVLVLFGRPIEVVPRGHLLVLGRRTADAVVYAQIARCICNHFQIVHVDLDTVCIVTLALTRIIGRVIVVVVLVVVETRHHKMTAVYGARQ